jgi:hypothetical protein
MYPLHPRLNVPLDLAEALAKAAVKSMAAAAQSAKSLRRRPRGHQTTLKPGLDTPLWNELADAVQARLKQYGEKARLARILGVPRQRVYEVLNRRRRMPDAERTLLLLVWLSVREGGGDLA